MRVLFETSEINGMKLANRFVRSATWEGMASEEGAVTPQLIRTMKDLSEGGVGLIISGHAYVSPEGQAGPWQLGIYKDELVEGLREMTDTVHQAGGKIVAQLAHAGAFGVQKLSGLTPHVVSYFEGLSKSSRHEMSKKDIKTLIFKFAEAAERAKEAGFDGVQLHSAHGYLLSQFLSPAYNRRTDEYGGPIENRVRIHLEILKAIRNRVGNDYPVLIKINSQDHVEGGLTLADSIAASKMIAKAGINAIELSGGTILSKKLSPSRVGINKQEKEAYFRQAAADYKNQIDVPLILVGGIRSLDVAGQLIKDNIADYISMSRPFIREPALINRWRSGDTAPAKCKSDNLCFGPALEGKGIHCVVEELEKNK